MSKSSRESALRRRRYPNAELLTGHLYEEGQITIYRVRCPHSDCKKEVWAFSGDAKCVECGGFYHVAIPRKVVRRFRIVARNDQVQPGPRRNPNLRLVKG